MCPYFFFLDPYLIIDIRESLSSSHFNFLIFQNISCNMGIPITIFFFIPKTAITKIFTKLVYPNWTWKNKFHKFTDKS